MFSARGKCMYAYLGDVHVTPPSSTTCWLTTLRSTPSNSTLPKRKSGTTVVALSRPTSAASNQTRPRRPFSWETPHSCPLRRAAGGGPADRHPLHLGAHARWGGNRIREGAEPPQSQGRGLASRDNPLLTSFALGARLRNALGISPAVARRPKRLSGQFLQGSEHGRAADLVVRTHRTLKMVAAGSPSVTVRRHRVSASPRAHTLSAY